MPRPLTGIVPFMTRIDLLGSDSKRAILQLIKRRGDVSLDDAVAGTGLARTTLREHLAGLEHDGLVERSATRRGRGRPRLLYRLTDAGDRLFPARDGVLLRELLGFLEHAGQSPLVEAFFTRFWEARLHEVELRLRTVAPDDGPGRLAVLEQILKEQGFMPAIDASAEEIVIRECNCPFPEAVKKTRLPCRLEARFFEQVLQRTARRVSYIPDGHAACTYAFARRPDEPDAAPRIA